MNKYKVLGVVVIDEVTHAAGEILELDPNGEQTKMWLEAGYIEAFVEPLPPVMVDYVVVKGPFANPDAEVFQTGNAIQFPEGDVFAEDALKAGIIMTKADHDALPKEVAGVVPASTSTGVGVPTTPSVAGSSEPRKRYRGKIVLVDSIRVVGAQKFHHIRTEEGHEYDLTAAEYNAEVKVSYPPQG